MIPPLQRRRAQTLRALQLMSAYDGLDWRVMAALAMHESRLDWLAEHRSAADRHACEVALERDGARLYRGSPWLAERWQWLVGRGPLGMVPAWHVHLWDPEASPLVLHDAAIVSLVAYRRVLRLLDARRKAGHEHTTWQHVHRSWKYGSSEPPKVSAEELAETDDAWRAYVAKLYPVAAGELALADRDVLIGSPSSTSIGSSRSSRDATRVAAVWRVLEESELGGRPTPDELADRLGRAEEVSSGSSPWGVAVTVGLLGAFGLLGLAATAYRRRSQRRAA